MKINRLHLIPLALLVFLLMTRMTCREIPLDRVGVKQRLLGSGVVQEDLAPGYTFVIPGVHRITLMDPTLQDYTMASHQLERQQVSTIFGSTERLVVSQGAPLEVRSRDGFTIMIDLTAYYRIRPGEAHRLFIENRNYLPLFQQQLRDVIRGELLNLQIADFYNARRRAEQAEQARLKLNGALKQYHLEVLNLLIRNVKLPEETEAELLRQQLYQQRKELAVDSQALERARAQTQMIERETTATVLSMMANLEKRQKNMIATTGAEIARIMADAQLEAQKMIAQADSYERQQIALGDLAKTSATAVGDKAMAEAYKGTGGELYLARQMLENVEIGDIEINTNETNPFDVRQMLELIGLDLDAWLEPRPAPGAGGN